MSVEVRAVELPGEAVRFCRTWWPIYADDPHWVPPCSPSARSSWTRAGTRSSGTRGCSASWPHAAAPRSAPSRPRRGSERSTSRESASSASSSSTTILRESGPLRGGDGHGCADQGSDGARTVQLLPQPRVRAPVDGFDTDPALLNPHNRDYYAAPLRSARPAGRARLVRLLARPRAGPGAARPRLPAVPRATPGGRRIRHFDLARWDEEDPSFWDIYNDAWEHNWGHVTRLGRRVHRLARASSRSSSPISGGSLRGRGSPAAVAHPARLQPGLEEDGRRRLPVGW